MDPSGFHFESCTTKGIFHIDLSQVQFGSLMIVCRPGNPHTHVLVKIPADLNQSQLDKSISIGTKLFVQRLVDTVYLCTSNPNQEYIYRIKLNDTHSISNPLHWA